MCSFSVVELSMTHLFLNHYSYCLLLDLWERGGERARESQVV